MLRTIALCLLLATPCLALADGEIPAKMLGKWSSATAAGNLIVELVSMDGSEKAKVKVTIDPAMNFHGAPCYFGTADTVATKGADGAWTMTAGKGRCPTYTIVFRPVEGKQRFEGQYTNDVGGQGKVFLEW